jgi:DNA-binding NtrC family response regulator
VGIRSIVRDVKARAEAQMIQSALENYGWNRRRAAQYLNISYRSLLYKIQQHRLKPWPAADVQASFPEETRSTHHQAV